MKRLVRHIHPEQTDREPTGIMTPMKHHHQIFADAADRTA